MRSKLIREALVRSHRIRETASQFTQKSSLGPLANAGNHLAQV